MIIRILIFCLKTRGAFDLLFVWSKYFKENQTATKAPTWSPLQLSPPMCCSHSNQSDPVQTKVHHVTLSLKALQWLPIHCPKNQIPTLHPDLESICELTPTSSPTAPPSPLCFSCSAFFWPFNQTSFRLKAFTATGPIFRMLCPLNSE